MSHHSNFIESLQDTPIIAAVKSDEGLSRALQSDCAVIFYLYGTILTLPALVAQAKERGKIAIVHLDLVEGLASRDVAAEYVARATKADGVISTRPALIRRAGELGLITIQRFFLLDSIAFDNVLRQSSHADAIDILPGTMPKIIKRLSEKVPQPIIASGLISDKQDIMAALGAGASAISSTNEALWFV